VHAYRNEFVRADRIVQQALRINPADRTAKAVSRFIERRRRAASPGE
jgi:hypothetical protein